MNFISYLVKTVVKELQEDYLIIKEIFSYHSEQVQEALELHKTKSAIAKRMKFCRSYHEWLAVAEEFDSLEPNRIYRQKVLSRYYDYTYIQDLLNLMREHRKANEIQKLVSVMRSHSFRNIGNINCPSLYRELYNRTKTLIEDFQKEITKSLKAILRTNQLSINRKIEFFSEMRHAIGRTALLLSGGALMGMYHIGVMLALKQAGIMPRIIAGSSAGSIVAGCIAVRGLEEAFDHTYMNYDAFPPEERRSLFWHLKRFFREGYMMDNKALVKFLRDNIGDYTFQEAYDKTGWILNITATGVGEHDQNRLLNYLTAPNVLIWSACAASCALPYVFGATEIYCKNADGQIETYVPFKRMFVDGSIGADLPMNNLSVLFNVNTFVVSQTNPWVVPFLDYTDETRTSRSVLVSKVLSLLQHIKSMILAEFKHRFSQLSDLGLFPSIVQRFLNVFSQNYVGNITIWPTPKLRDYIDILRMPSASHELDRFVEVGRQRTYPSNCSSYQEISLIKATMHFEAEIEKCLKKAKYVSQSRLNLAFRMSEASIAEKHSREEEDIEVTLKLEVDRKKRLSRNESFMNPRELKLRRL